MENNTSLPENANENINGAEKNTQTSYNQADEEKANLEFGTATQTGTATDNNVLATSTDDNNDNDGELTKGNSGKLSERDNDELNGTEEGDTDLALPGDDQ